MSTCPCCSDRLLRHIRKGSLYWFCRSCWAEMPNFEESKKFPVVAPIRVPPTLVPIAPCIRTAALQELPTFVKLATISATRITQKSAA